MKILFNHSYQTEDEVEEDFYLPSLQEDIEKTRKNLEAAYAGFDNALEPEMIDCYIFEINALLKRYTHLSNLAAKEAITIQEPPNQQSPIRSLVSIVIG